MSEGYPRKRARTRRQLLRAGMTVLAGHGPDGTTVGEVARRARVAPGTFYNHFPSLAELVREVTDELATGVEIARDLLVEVEHDPAARVLIGTRQLLDLARDDPDAAEAFVALLATVPDFRTRIRATVRGAVADGIEAGRFHDRSAGVTADAVLGAVVQWMRSRLAGEAESDSDRDHHRLILAIVGVPGDEVDAVIERTLRLDAPAAAEA